jgi:hypothetical protein
MKNLSLIFIIIFLLSINSFSQTADEIVEKYTNAIGGKEKWDLIKSEKKSGKFNTNNMEFPFISNSKRPNLNFTEVTVQGMTIKQAFDGTMGWMLNPMTGSNKAEKMDEDMTKTMKNRGIIGGQLVNYKELECTIELIAKGDMEGTEVYNIKLTSKEGDVVDYFIDASSYLLIKSTSKVKRMGQEVSSETYYSNYKPVGEVMEAYSIESKVSGMDMGSQKIVIEKIEQNIDIDDNLFNMPIDHNK